MAKWTLSDLTVISTSSTVEHETPEHLSLSLVGLTFFARGLSIFLGIACASGSRSTFGGHGKTRSVSLPGVPSFRPFHPYDPPVEPCIVDALRELGGPGALNPYTPEGKAEARARAYEEMLAKFSVLFKAASFVDYAELEVRTLRDYSRWEAREPQHYSRRDYSRRALAEGGGSARRAEVGVGFSCSLAQTPNASCQAGCQTGTCQAGCQAASARGCNRGCNQDCALFETPVWAGEEDYRLQLLSERVDAGLVRLDAREAFPVERGDAPRAASYLAMVDQALGHVPGVTRVARVTRVTGVPVARGDRLPNSHPEGRRDGHPNPHPDSHLGAYCELCARQATPAQTVVLGGDHLSGSPGSGALDRPVYGPSILSFFGPPIYGSLSAKRPTPGPPTGDGATGRRAFQEGGGQSAASKEEEDCRLNFFKTRVGCIRESRGLGESHGLGESQGLSESRGLGPGAERPDWPSKPRITPGNFAVNGSKPGSPGRSPRRRLTGVFTRPREARPGGPGRVRMAP